MKIKHPIGPGLRPIYQSSTISKNEDDTYAIVHHFQRPDSSRFRVEIPFVRLDFIFPLTIEHTIPPFPFSDCTVLYNGRDIKIVEEDA